MKITKHRFLKIFLITTILLFLVFSLTIAIITTNANYQMPDVMNVELYDSDGKKYLSYSNGKKQSYVKLCDISDNLKNAFISIEDKSFYTHHGINIKRIIGAFISNIKNKKIVEGASTITQQYVKNLYLNSEKTWKRKINEMLIATNLERNYTKDEILEGYLNSIYFDHGIYGVEDASIFYFGKHAKDLSLKEAVSIASIPKGPTIYSPIKNEENNYNRSLIILDEMLKDKLITKEDYDSAISGKLLLVGNNPFDDSTSAPYFQDVVLKELSQIPSIKFEKSTGLKVYTTLDSKLNEAIVKSIDKRFPESELEIAIYVIEPSTGNVLSIIGGKDYVNSSYNRAVSAVRQPGSTIKPFLYLAAIENGFTPATTFKSEKTTFYYDNITYSPTNFGDIYANKDVSMTYAIATSDNIYAVKTHLFLGCNVLAKRLKDFGFSGNIPPIPSLALGVKEVSLKELTEGYSIFANLGYKLNYKYITKITDFDGNTLYDAKVKKVRVAKCSDVFILNEAMTSVFDNNMTYNIRPTGVSIRSLISNKYAGKSGSTDTDNWMVGFNKNICACVWTGFDDCRDVTKASETKICKYIWADIVQSYHNIHNLQDDWYSIPSDVVSLELNPISGFYGGFKEYTKKMYFTKDNLPWFYPNNIFNEYNIYKNG